MDLRKFPFDEQVCPLRFKSWIYHGAFLNLIPMEKGCTQTDKVEEWKEAKEWTFVGVDIERRDRGWNAASGTWPLFSFLVKVKRNPQYYVSHGILPVMLLTGLSMNPCWFGVRDGETGSGERMTFSLTLLLTIF